MLSKPLLHHLFQQVRRDEIPFAVRYWDGTTEHYGGGRDASPPLAPAFTLALNDPAAFRLQGGDVILQFGEAYMRGAVDVEGDLEEMVALATRSGELVDQVLPPRLVKALSRAPRPHRRSQRRQQDDIATHYDLGNDFFRLWLDESLTYSCAYFQTGSETLEEAQSAKIDHSLHKLRLKPGEALLDIGCGWGALVMRAAQRHGVRAMGITLSQEQQRGACAQIEARGLAGRADVRLTHYATLAQQASKHAARPFDKIVSIGMMEHIGKAHLPEFAEAVETLLRPGGLALLHMITSVNEGPLNSWSQKYIFPGAYIPTLPEVLGTLNATHHLHVWDVENLGPHYRRTLEAWADRFERAIPRITEMYDETFVRMWRLYLRGTAACFREGTLEIHQMLVSRGLPNPPLPPIRADLYA